MTLKLNKTKKTPRKVESGDEQFPAQGGGSSRLHSLYDQVRRDRTRPRPQHRPKQGLLVGTTGRTPTEEEGKTGAY